MLRSLGALYLQQSACLLPARDDVVQAAAELAEFEEAPLRADELPVQDSPGQEPSSGASSGRASPVPDVVVDVGQAGARQAPRAVGQS